MQAGEGAAHGFTLMNRSHAEISGVIDVDCFNEQVVVLRTPMGTLTISGAALNISHLNLEEGRLVVEGEFASAEYSQGKRAGGKGFLGRLFS